MTTRIKSKPNNTAAVQYTTPRQTKVLAVLVFGAKNGQTTNRKGMDLISRFVVRAQKLIFRCHPSGLGMTSECQVMPNMAPMYVGHRPTLLCQRESL